MKHKVTLNIIDDVTINLSMTIDEIESLEVKLIDLTHELYRLRRHVTMLEKELGND